MQDKSEVHRDSYFEMFILYYCGLLIQIDEGDTIYTYTAIYNIFRFKDYKVTIHHQQSIGINTLFSLIVNRSGTMSL